MTDCRYKAYISYSHKDEAWAAWLHRALESYHIPRKLVGTESAHGPVPARIRPVFRDREDLSSASDLGQTVKHSLTDSENLIVICSPAAVASRWVNEEIRQFSRSGRVDRIFCIIVDGSASIDGSIGDILPTALTEVGLQEPLAADARAWADGKKTAKLKLVAGMLGIHLDELRQRDLQRQRKRRVIIGLGIVAAVSLSVMTVISQIAEQHEREKAEQLATFVVDLGERLRSDADLETLALIGAEATRHLENLDLDRLSPETGEKVALAFRQMGNVNQGQGNPVEAQADFERSRNILLALTVRYPESQELLFQLGNAEFYIGDLHRSQDRYEKARQSMEKYQKLTQQLFEMDPENPDWVLELSYSHNNIAALQLEGGGTIDDETLFHIGESVRLMEEVVRLKPDDMVIAEDYATALAWAADAQLQTCNLDAAMVLRERVRELAENASLYDPGNNIFKRGYAFALTGVSRLQAQLGRLLPAELNLRKSISILQQLYAADQSNVNYRKQMVYRQIMLADLLQESGQPAAAWTLAEELKPETEAGGVLVTSEESSTKEYINYLIVLAKIELHSGNSVAANSNLEEAIKLQVGLAASRPWDRFDKIRFQKMHYQWWKGNGQEGHAEFSIPRGLEKNATGEYQSCTESDYQARMHLIDDDRETAANLVKYLRSRGYSAPGFMKFCEENNLCSPVAQGETG